MAARDPSLALTTLLCTFTRISSIAKKFFFTGFYLSTNQKNNYEREKTEDGKAADQIRI